MSVNHYDDHLLIFPEDEANEKIANGFVLHSDVLDSQVRVLRTAGGWNRLVEVFEKDYIQSLRRFPKRRIVLLLDFDESQDRRGYAGTKIPNDVQSRVFLLGVWSEPERLKSALGAKPLEAIGGLVAEDCSRGTSMTWSHELLKHSEGELIRLRRQVRPFLFDA